MRLTGTPNARSPFSLEVEDLTPDQLLSLFSTFQVGEKDGLAFLPALLSDCPGAGGCRGGGKKCHGGPHRLAVNVTHLTALVVDLDGSAPAASYPYDCYAWQTYSHSDARPCWRLVFPFATPLSITSPEEWSQGYWPALMGALGFSVSADPACRDPARLYFTPRKPTADAVRQAYFSPGPMLDPTAVERPATRVFPAGGKMVEKEGYPPDPSRPVDLERFREGLARIRRVSLAPLAKALLAGTALTPAPSRRVTGQSSRYQAWLRATALVANLAEGWEVSSALLELLRASFAAEVAESPEDHTAWETIEGLLESARADAVEYRAKKEAARQAADDALRKGIAALSRKDAEGDPPLLASSDSTWESALQVVSDGNGGTRVKPSAANVELILRCSDAWRNTLRFNEVTRGIEVWGGPLPGFGDGNRAVRGSDAARVADWFSREALNITVSDSIVWARMESVAESNAYDPLKDSLPLASDWDGKSRVDEFFVRYFGSPRTQDGNDLSAHLRTLSRRFLVQLVARALAPGCKADTVVVLEGAQGTGKSSALAILGGVYYTDASLDPHDKDSLAIASQMHLVELGELDALKRAEVTALKQFLSKTFDDYRPPYGRVSVRCPRRCVFVGTTNESTYLQDTTGNRRWWPVRCGAIDLEGLRRDRGQLLSEARRLYEAGEQWHLTSEESTVAAVEAESRMAPDAVAEAIEDYLLEKPKDKRPEYLRTADVCRDILQTTSDRAAEIKVGNALRRLRFRRVRVRVGELSRWVYALPESLKNAERCDRRNVAKEMSERREDRN